MTGNFFSVETDWGSQVQVRHEDGMLVHRSRRRYIKRCSRVIGYTPADAPGLLFLLPEDGFKGARLVLPGQPWLGRIRILRIRRKLDGDAVHLVEPYTGLFASARELDEKYQAVGAIQADNALAGPWEGFRLHPVAEVGPGIWKSAREIDAGVNAGGAALGVYAMLASGAPNYDVLQACGRLLTPDELAPVARQWLQAPKALASLSHQAADRHAAEALPRLSRWLSSDRRSETTALSIGVADDPMERAWFDDPPPSLAAVCAAAVRAETSPRRRLAVLATVRNEGLYLIDWLAYHRAVGVEAFFIYTNDNDDRGSDALLGAMARAGVIHLVRNLVGPGVRPQFKAYGHALQALPEVLDYAWIAAIDADEYLRFDERKFEDFCAFLRWQEALEVDSIGLSWLLHTPNHQARYDRRPVIDRFPHVAAEGNAHIKSVFRPNRFVHAHCHFPVPPHSAKRVFRTADGAPAPSGEPFNHKPNYDHAWVAHYYFKSVEEYLVRRLRNRGDGAVMAAISEDMISEGLAAMVVEQFAREPSLPVQISAALDDRIRRETARLQALPGVMDAFLRCEAGFAEESRNMRRRLAANPRFSRSGSSEAALLALLEGRSLPLPVMAEAL